MGDILSNKKYNKKMILDHIFNLKFDPEIPEQSINFYLDDIRAAGDAIGMDLPTSYSNFVLDLCRKNRGIQSRVPEVVRMNGYDLCKKTGVDTNNGKKFVGQFQFVGIGNEIESWLVWPESSKTVVVDSEDLHSVVRKLLRKDEAALFSIIDYFDLLSYVVNDKAETVFRLQAPMKWQPNEIDGMYFYSDSNSVKLIPVEAKALSTGDEINIDQLKGGYETVLEQIKKFNLTITPTIQVVAAQMVRNGIRFAIYAEGEVPGSASVVTRIDVSFEPALESWS